MDPTPPYVARGQWACEANRPVSSKRRKPRAQTGAQYQLRERSEPTHDPEAQAATSLPGARDKPHCHSSKRTRSPLGHQGTPTRARPYGWD